MRKPNGFDEVTVSGDFIPVALGGHHSGVIELTEQQSSTGKDMVVVKIDFAKSDSQPGYFTKQYNEDTREGKKWPYIATQYILTEDSEGKCSRNFKSFITSIERSNNCKINWDSKDFCGQFKNKKIGVVFGEVEEEYNGEVKTRRKIRWFCEDSKVESQNVPERKNLPGTISNTETSTSATYVDVSTTEDMEIPF